MLKDYLLNRYRLQSKKHLTTIDVQKFLTEFEDFTKALEKLIIDKVQEYIKNND